MEVSSKRDFNQVAGLTDNWRLLLSNLDNTVRLSCFALTTRDEHSTLFQLRQPLRTSLGPVDLQIEVEPADLELQDQHVLNARTLVSHFRRHERKVQILLYESYRRCDVDWLKYLGIQTGLDALSALALVKDLRLVVAVAPDDSIEGQYRRFYARPAWDEEHAFYLSPNVETEWSMEDY